MLMCHFSNTHAPGPASEAVVLQLCHLRDEVLILSTTCVYKNGNIVACFRQAPTYTPR